SRGETPDGLVRRLAKLLDMGLGITPAAEAIPIEGEDPKQALRAMRYALDSFLKEGLAGPPPARLSEALSRAMQQTPDEVGALGSSQFVERATKLIARYPKARGRLLFELTESAALEDLQVADRHLRALRDEGCEICLDDFGAGAASLAYLQQLSLDVLKIDG